MKDILIDTNIFLRFLTEDNPEQAEKVERFLEKTVGNSDYKLIITEAVVMELVWTLDSFYELDEQEVKRKILPILEFTEVIYPSNDFDWRKVFDIQIGNNIDFIDGFNYLLAQQEDIKTILSFDDDFDRLEGVTRKQP